MFEFFKLAHRPLRQWGTALAMAGLVGATTFVPLPAAAAGNQLTDVTFMLDFSAMGRHAPWYVALDKGYFKQAGLNVKIVPGQGTAQSLQALEAGVAQFAFSDPTSLVLGRARGVSSGVFVEMNYQKAPYAVFSLKDGANVTHLSQFKGLTIASSSDSMTPRIIQGLMAQRGMDPSAVKFTNVAGSARPGVLLSGKVPAIETFVFGQVGMERSAKPGNLRTFLLADHGLTLYSDGVLVKQDYLKAHPKIVKAFVSASLKGWHDALSNMDEAARIEQKYVPSLNREVIVGELKLLKKMAVIPVTKEKGLGYIDPARMKESVDFVVKYVGIEGTAPMAKDLYTNEFIPNPPVMP
ncbi:MAG TPA: ABC transporter substrate-binding protein [Castellaniella sp.]|uniref:ABC transporter substrate-binding protein n=1 Tax=Castellaniella sp. TaxID=1955812 RepID=UPI002EE715E3